MASTPYELRFQMLMEAKTYLEGKYLQERENLTQRYYAETEAGKNPQFPSLPSYPTLDDIQSLAEQMNRFVSNK